jgi:hypothetical protein
MAHKIAAHLSFAYLVAPLTLSFGYGGQKKEANVKFDSPMPTSSLTMSISK